MVLFIVWALLSVLSQSTTKIKNKIKMKDALNILPNYKFFCPNPIKHDYYLYYREQLPDSSWSEWKKIFVGGKMPIICSIWNPFKRDRKVLYKIVKDLKRHTNKKGKMYNLSIHQHLSEFVTCRVGTNIHQFKITIVQAWNEELEEKDLYTSVA